MTKVTKSLKSADITVTDKTKVTGMNRIVWLLSLSRDRNTHICGRSALDGQSYDHCSKQWSGYTCPSRQRQPRLSALSSEQSRLTTLVIVVVVVVDISGILSVMWFDVCDSDLGQR